MKKLVILLIIFFLFSGVLGVEAAYIKDFFQKKIPYLPSCFDSDGGKNYEEKGEITYSCKEINLEKFGGQEQKSGLKSFYKIVERKGKSYQCKFKNDFCQNDNSLMEQTCVGDADISVAYNCNEGWGVCEDGRCQEASPGQKIADLKIFPKKGITGTLFTIYTKTFLNPEEIAAGIKKDGEPILRIKLYDDGRHGDNAANDGKYANVFDSTTYGTGVYTVEIETDSETRKTIFLISLPTAAIIPSSCLELIPGHNNLCDERINVVFVGINYNNTDTLRNYANIATDYLGVNYGMFSLSPWKSNKGLFNFFYVDENAYTKSNESYWDYAPIADSMAMVCPFSNKRVVALVNEVGGGYAALGVFAVVSFMPDFYPYQDILFNFSVGTFAHEIGHSIGETGDEYVKSSLGDTFEFINEGNCYGPSSYKDCIENSPWFFLVGNGCGEEGILDCSTNVTGGSLEVGCFMGGCYFQNRYRPTSMSIMQHSFPITKSYSYGLVNERIFCLKLKEVTGKQVTCENICEHPCEKGQKCIGGRCKNV